MFQAFTFCQSLKYMFDEPQQGCFPSSPIPAPQKDNFLVFFMSPTLHLFHPALPPLTKHRTEQADCLLMFVHLNFKATNLKGHLSQLQKKKWLLLWYIRLESLPSQCRVVNINTNKMLLWVILQFYHIYFTSLSQILSMLWSISLVCSSCVYSALHA